MKRNSDIANVRKRVEARLVLRDDLTDTQRQIREYSAIRLLRNQGEYKDPLVCCIAEIHQRPTQTAKLLNRYVSRFSMDPSNKDLLREIGIVVRNAFTQVRLSVRNAIFVALCGNPNLRWILGRILPLLRNYPISAKSLVHDADVFNFVRKFGTTDFREGLMFARFLRLYPEFYKLYFFEGCHKDLNMFHSAFSAYFFPEHRLPAIMNILENSTHWSWGRDVRTFLPFIAPVVRLKCPEHIQKKYAEVVAYCEKFPFGQPWD